MVATMRHLAMPLLLLHTRGVGNAVVVLDAARPSVAVVVGGGVLMLMSCGEWKSVGVTVP